MHSHVVDHHPEAVLDAARGEVGLPVKSLHACSVGNLSPAAVCRTTCEGLEKLAPNSSTFDSPYVSIICVDS